MPDFAEQLGAMIRQVRIRRGISQEELSARSRITRSYLSQIENGKFNMRLDTLEAICRALQVHPSQLLLTIRLPE